MPEFPATIAGARARLLVDAVREWAESRPDIVAVVLHGSWATGTARPDSDVDLLVVAHDTGGYLAWHDWLSDFGKPGDRIVERRDGASALRVWYADGPEVEFTLVTPAAVDRASGNGWLAAALAPESVALHDPEGIVERARESLAD